MDPRFGLEISPQSRAGEMWIVRNSTVGGDRQPYMKESSIPYLVNLQPVV
jgi:hypothetical protein